MTSDIPSLGLFNLLNAAGPAPKIPTLEDIGRAWADIPDDVLFARLRAAGFTVGAPQEPPLDRDLMEAAADHEDWWKEEAP